MRAFFLATLAFSASAIGLAVAAGHPPTDVLSVFVARIAKGIPTALIIVAVVSIGPGAIAAWRGWRPGMFRISEAAIAMIGTLILLSAFVIAKTSIPDIVPFYADPALARLDAALHFGHDPWRLAHAAAGWLPPGLADFLYLVVWCVMIFSLPLWIAFDTDPERQRAYSMLYVAGWVVIGTVLALAGSSVGPVYFDQLTGEDRFADLHLALEASGVSTSTTGGVQRLLWDGYSGDARLVAPGISAFPSVHVSLACVAALYASERSRIAGLVGWVYLGAILFLSVRSGYHYAIDGYVSIAVMVALRAWLMRSRPAPHTVGVARA